MPDGDVFPLFSFTSFGFVFVVFVLAASEGRAVPRELGRNEFFGFFFGVLFGVPCVTYCFRPCRAGPKAARISSILMCNERTLGW